MFLYFSQRKFSGQLEIAELKLGNEAWLTQVAAWVEHKWGYLRGYPGLEARKNLVRQFLNNPNNQIFIVTYAKQPVGMFAFAAYAADFLKDEVVKELTYFYVAFSFRSMGVGSTILKMAKQKAKERGIDMLVFDTLNPQLNHFYEKEQGKEVAEARLLGAPTSLFRMDIDTTISDEELASSVFAQSDTAKRLSYR
jgi:GNAT superfamily N-acetyltransferase